MIHESNATATVCQWFKLNCHDCRPGSESDSESRAASNTDSETAQAGLSRLRSGWHY